MGRNGYRRDFRTAQPGYQDSRHSSGHHGGEELSITSKEPPRPARGSHGAHSSHYGQQEQQHSAAANGSSRSSEGSVENIEKRLTNMQQDFTQAIHKIGEKEGEKFDLIFAILSELQSRQAQLEETVRSLKAQYGNGQPMANGGYTGQNQMAQQQQFGSSGAQFAQMGSPMNGQTMPQFAGVMQADGTMGVMQAMPQVIVMQPNNGMQYTAVPQMIQTPNGVVQAIPANQMAAMQFVQQGVQPAAMSPMAIGKNSPSSTATPASSPQSGSQEEATEDGSQGGNGAAETSSQEGKVDDASPEFSPIPTNAA